MLESLTLFDAIAVTLIIVSAIMALARGFMRELATLGAFIAALAAAYYARMLMRDQVAGWLPEGVAEWMPDAILVVSAFLIVYIVVAWFGQRLSKGIQGLEGIGLLDRIAGFAFGAARGFVAMVFFVVIMNLALDSARVPSFIQDAYTYPIFKQAADYVNLNAPKAVEDARDKLPLADQALPLGEEKVQ